MKLHHPFSVSQQIYLKKSTSTNDYSIEWSSNNNPNSNICVYTYNQTDGRGQIGRFWYSGEYKNLAMTLLLTNLQINVKDQFLLNKTVCLAVFELIKKYIKEGTISIKWPNDIYVDNEKIAGILIQNQLRSEKIHRTIIGIGLNVNENAFPKEIPNPSSIFQKTNDTNNLFRIKNELLRSVLLKLNNLHFAKKEIEKSYQNNLFRKDIKSHFEIEGIKKEGTILGVSDHGKLIIIIDGIEQQFAFRELNYII